MNVTPLLLLVGVVEHLITKSPLAGIAKKIGASFEELSDFKANYESHSWRGKLTIALSKPDHPGQQISYLTQLARLEEQYTELMHQYRRAEQTCEALRRQSGDEGVPYALLMKADAFSNKVHQQSLRVLKDLEKTEQKLNQAAAESPTDSAPTIRKAPKPTTAKTDSNHSKNTEIETTSNTPSTTIPATSIPNAQPNPTEQLPDVQSPTPQNVPAQPPAEQNRTEQPLASSNQTLPPEELQEVLFKNRYRLKIVPQQQRPAFIAKIIEQHLANKNNPHQNGKHAA